MLNGPMKLNEQTKRLISAGGVVYRFHNGAREIVVCGRNDPKIWGLPKGTPDEGETRQQTAIREVQEETGLQVAIKVFIDSIDYRFVDRMNLRGCCKAVLFYLMAPTGGDMSLHDHEFGVVEWMAVDKAYRTLTYPNEVRIVRKGVSLVSEDARGD